MAANKAWALKDARDLIAAMRTKVNSYGYEITLGGGVIVNGSSSNDLDLFFIPSSDVVPPLPVDLLMWLVSKFGLGKTIIPAQNAAAGLPIPTAPQTHVPPASPSTFAYKMRFDLAGRKIDVFVV